MNQSDAFWRLYSKRVRPSLRQYGRRAMRRVVRRMPPPVFRALDRAGYFKF